MAKVQILGSAFSQQAYVDQHIRSGNTPNSVGDWGHKKGKVLPRQQSRSYLATFVNTINNGRKFARKTKVKIRQRRRVADYT